jgi:hypothetical protein
VFAVTYSFSSQKAHYISLFFFTGLHYWFWTTTWSANLTSTINTRVVRKGMLSLCFPESPPDVRTVCNFQCNQLTRHENYARWLVFIWLPLIRNSIHIAKYLLATN